MAAAAAAVALVDGIDGERQDNCRVWSECAKCAIAADENVTFQTACQSFSDHVHAAHAMIYAHDDRLLWNKYRVVADIMMQVRFDGLLGFPGGFVDSTDKSIVDGLNRELEEEIGLDIDQYRVDQDEHIVSHVCSHRKLATHFYAKHVTVQQFEEIEKRVFTAHDWGSETLGVVRVPLHTMQDGDRGFPLFLAGKFAGNSRKQLITAILSRRILNAEAVQRAVDRAKQLVNL